MKAKNRKKVVWCMIFAMLISSCMADGFGAQAAKHAKSSFARKLVLNMSSITMQAGDRMNLKVTKVTPASASKKVTWKSSNKKVVKVTKSGVIRARKKGRATISAKAKNGKGSAKCRVKVNRKKVQKTNVLVAYFSATNTTKGVAEKIARAADADLYRITPAKKYTAKDLNYRNNSCRANKEQNQKKARPAMKGKCAGIQKYDVIFVGFPIWWQDAPRIMSTFMESYRFGGKTVIPFCTSGSSGIKKAVKTLKSVTKGNVTWRSGKRFGGDESQAEVAKWVAGFHLQDNHTENVPPSMTPEPSPSTAPLATLPPGNQNKTLVAYFSCTGSTKGIAEKIAAQTRADLYEITPEVPYTDADLNYGDSNSRTSIEQNDASARPAISGSVTNMRQYRTVFVGYPIWHGKAPRIMDSFIESYDFSGKRMIPFCTSASSGMGSSAAELQALCEGNAAWDSGRRFSGNASETEIAEWIKELGVAENSSAAALAEKLAEGELTIPMQDYANFEKVGPLGFDLPTKNSGTKSPKL